MAAEGPATLTVETAHRPGFAQSGFNPGPGGYQCDGNPHCPVVHEGALVYQLLPFETCPVDHDTDPVVTPRKRARTSVDIHADYHFPPATVDRSVTLKSLAFKDARGNSYPEAVLHTWSGAAADGPYDLTSVATPRDARQIDLLFEARAFDPVNLCNVVQVGYGAIDCDACNASAGDPVALADGSMRLDDTDPLPPLFEKALTRSYQSGQGESGLFGRGWTTPFDQMLNVTSSTDVGVTFISTSDDNRVAFNRDWTQIWPKGTAAPGQLTYSGDAGVYLYREPGSGVATVFDADGYFVGLLDIISNRELRVTRNYAAGGVDLLSLTALDSWTGATWTLSLTNGVISHIAASGGSTWTYGYENGDLVTVTGPAGVWRTYVYGNGRMTEARDAKGKLIESHQYDSQGRAITSSGPSDEITSIEYDLPAPGDGRKTRVTTANGGVTDIVLTPTGGSYRVDSRTGGCSSCGARDEVDVYDRDGHAIRRQDADGYISTSTYAGGYLKSTRSFLRPAACEPSTSATHCRLTPATLAAATLVATPATLETTYSYEDPDWPDRPSEIATTSVRKPDDLRRQQFTFESPSSVTGTQTVDGWTAYPTPLEQTRTTTRTRYDGTEGAAFSFSGFSWAAVPQPMLTKSVDGPRSDVGDTTTFVYYPVHASVPAESRGRLAATRNALGQIVRFEDYDLFGNARRIVDPNGVVTEMTTDSIGRITSTTLKGLSSCSTSLDSLCATDLVTARVYDELGPLVRDVRAGGGVTAYEYDARGRVQSVSRGLSATDLRERMETTWDPTTGKKSMEKYLSLENASWVEKRRESYAYDSEGRLSLTTHADGATIAYTYDSASRLATVRDENHAAPNTTYAYGPGGHVATVTQTLAGAAGGTAVTAYAFDAHGNLTSVTDPNGNVTAYRNDDFGQMIRQESPVTGVTSYSYDPAGALLATTDANAAATTRTYDALGRVLTAGSTRGTASESVSWTYDSNPLGIGRLSSMSDPSGSTTYAYERRGLLRQEEKTIAGTPYTTTYGYDADGNRQSIGYPSGRSVQYTFDFAGRPLTASAGSTAFVTSASYLPFGPQTELVFGNGTAQTFRYDARYRPLENKLAAGATTLADYSYAADPAGNITQIHDALDPSYDRDFGYDDLNRLTSANGGSSLWGTGSYSYDAMGNMLTRALGSSRTASFVYASTLPKLASVTESGSTRSVSYDAAGNETAVGTGAYGYTARNSLRSGDGALYEYDGRGVRAITLIPGNAAASIAAPATVPGGVAATATVTLQSAATAVTTVTLTSSNPAVLPVPASLTVGVGQASGTFPFTPGTVTSSTAVSLCATSATTVCTSVTVVPAPAIASLSLTPASLVPGLATGSGTVTLAGAAPVALDVALTASPSGLATVPASVHFNAGATTASYTLTPLVGVPSATTVTVAATLANTATATIRLDPPIVTSIEAPATVASDATVPYTIHIQGYPVPGGTLAVTSNNPAALTASVATQSGSVYAGTLHAAHSNTATAVVLSVTSGTTTVTTAVTAQACTVSPAAPVVPSTDAVWIDDTWPSWSNYTEPAAGEPGSWDTAQHATGTKSIDGGSSADGSPTGFTFSGGSQLPSNTLVAYALVNGCVTPPAALDVVVEFSNGKNVPSDLVHLYWGDGSLIDTEVDTEDELGNLTVTIAPKIRIGEVPAEGQWQRLEVPMNVATGSTRPVVSLAYRSYGGRVWWDHLGFTTVTAAARISELTTPSSHAYGSALTWTATAVGGGSSIQYRFERQDGAVWTTVQPYGSSGTYTWTPGAGDAGSHTVRISVRNSGSTADAEDARTIPIDITTGWAALTVPASVLLARGSQPPGPIALSFTARFAAAASGDLQKYSLYTPELNLMSETEMTSNSAPAMAYDYVWFGGKPVGQMDIATSTPHWTFTDHLGTPILQTNAAGAIDWRAEYEPFGTVYTLRTGTSRHQPLRFPGQEADAADGERSYNIFRWYRSGWGRYTQGDPLGVALPSGAETTNYTANDGINLYAYAGQNTITYIDPRGESVVSATVSFVGGFVGGAASTVAVSWGVAAGTVAGGAVAVVVVGVGAYQTTIAAQRLLLGIDPYTWNRLSWEERADIAAGFAGGIAGGAMALRGSEIVPSNPKRCRIAPFGNRTGHETGELPHYHRAVPDPTKPGDSLPGQGIGRHRPWDTKATDKSFWDRF